MLDIRPVTLAGAAVTLVPLAREHADGLAAAAADGDVHRLWVTTVPAPDRVAAEIERRLGLMAAGTMLPFTVVAADGRLAGMTTYMNIDKMHRRVEIGHTWYGRSVQRTGLNTEAKRLLLGHAFETLACIAVEFRTHRLNRASRAAIERIGAQLDGILRNHQILPDGSLRDTCVYSIIAHEWPAVRGALDDMMRLPAPPAA